MIVKTKINVSRFLLALFFCLAAASTPVDSAGDQGKEGVRSVPTKVRQYVTEVDYAITTMKFQQYQPATNTLPWVTRCVFHPIYSLDVLPQDSQANITQSALNQLKSYRVYRRDGQLLNHKYGPFAIAATDLPRFFAAAAVPPEGCGDFLVTGDGKVVTAKPPGDLDVFMQIFKQEEKPLFTSALRRLPEWVTEEQRREIAKHDLNEIYARSKKFDIGTFYDSQTWYLVRSYMAERLTTLNALIFYKIDFTRKKLLPQLVALNMSRGEGWARFEYFGALDLNNDGANEPIVEVIYENGYFTYLSREADGWRLR